MRVRLTDCATGVESEVFYPSLDQALGAVLSCCIHDLGAGEVAVERVGDSKYAFSRVYCDGLGEMKRLKVLAA